MYSLADYFEDPENLYLQNALHISSIVFGVTFLVVGLIYVALGKRLTKLCMFFTGFQALGFTLFTVMVITSAEEADLTSYTIFAASLVAGLFGGIICAYWVKLGIYVSGFSLGAEIWCIIYWFINYDHLALFLTPAIVLGIVGTILTYKYMEKMVIIGTSFIGSQLFMHGVSFLASVGYFVNISLDPDNQYSPGPFWGIFISSLVLAAIGITFQLYQYSSFEYLPKDPKTAEDYMNC